MIRWPQDPRLGFGCTRSDRLARARRRAAHIRRSQTFAEIDGELHGILTGGGQAFRECIVEVQHDRSYFVRVHRFHCVHFQNFHQGLLESFVCTANWSSETKLPVKPRSRTYVLASTESASPKI